jgi:hypothetical protein
LSCSDRRASFLAGLLSLMLTGCGGDPPPFEPPAKLAATTALLAPGADSGMTLVPIVGLPPQAGRALGGRIAEQLQQREIAASTRTASAARYILQGEATTQLIDQTQLHIDFVWRLVDPTGLTAGTITQEETVPALAVQSGDTAVITGIAERAAIRIEALVRPEPKQAAGTLAPRVARVFVRAVEGAPGDGRTSLTQAIRHILAQNNVTVVEQEDAEALLALGTVRLQDRGAVQLVQIEWRVLKPDGTTAGTVSQQNQIPKGLLDGPWGPTATAAASGSAEGLLQILRSAAAAGP